ncbi:PP2C family protein-serine/threonine phosphatase [bacterium]|nr:PP2C family protein-serine/threonine phosphatase [candidate division CSSED10-310 bacterium]
MEFKQLYKKIESTVAALEYTQDEQELIYQVLEVVVRGYGDALGIRSGRLYARVENDYVLERQIGDSNDKYIGLRFPAQYLPVIRIRENKYVIMHKDDKELDINLEPFLVTNTFAAIAVGHGDKYLVSFSVDEPVDEQQLIFSLNTIRFATNFKLRELMLQDEFLKAREIQLSLLPDYEVSLANFEVYGRSVPATLVGGDAFDYFRIGDDSLGIAVLDAVGHGLPAALQARDAITGLRMAMFSKLKIEFMMDQLNQVIHRSNLSSRFVSMFYCELEDYGHLVYTNAGHPAPLFATQTGIYDLQRGGMVLGPNPKATYKRGFAFMMPGDYLVIYSDGITEARNKTKEMFGVERLKAFITDNMNVTAHEMVDKIFECIFEFSGSDTRTDDQTLVVIRRIGDPRAQF